MSTVSERLISLGETLQNWEKMEMKDFAKEITSTAKSMLEAFEETKQAHYLLCSFFLQSLMSSLMGRTALSEVLLKSTYKPPKKALRQLGKKLTDLGEIIEDYQKTIDMLIEILIVAYESDLIISLKP